MKKIVLIAGLLVVSNGWADGLTLLCSGIATEESEIEKNTNIINKNSKKLIFLNYPGSEISMDLKRINSNLFEFKE